MTMTIEYLRLENIGRHHSFYLDPGSLGMATEITGGGETGKTTVLDSIIIALTGKGPRGLDELVTNGEMKGYIETVVDGVKIKRIIKDGKTIGLDVFDRDGKLINKASQTWLDSVFGKGCILRPMELFEMADKDRAKAIFNACGIDRAVAGKKLQTIMESPSWAIGPDDDIRAVIKQAYDTAYANRKEVRAKRKELTDRAAALRAQIPADFNPAGLPPEPPSAGDLYRTRTEAVERNNKLNYCANAIEDLLGQDVMPLGDATKTSLVALRDRFLDQRTNVTTIDEQIAKVDEQQKAYRTTVGAFESLRLRLEEAVQCETAAAKLDEGVAYHEAQVKRLERLPAELLAGSALPVEGMELRGDEVWWEGVPLEKHGDSGILTFCVKVAMALAPAKFVLIDGCEKLDPAQRKKLVGYIISQDFQAIMTRVTEGPLALAPVLPPDDIEMPAVEAAAVTTPAPASASADDEWSL